MRKKKRPIKPYQTTPWGQMSFDEQQAALEEEADYYGELAEYHQAQARKWAVFFWCMMAVVAADIVWIVLT